LIGFCIVLLDEELDQGGVCAHTPSPEHWFCKRKLQVPWRDAAQVRPVGSSDGAASGKEVSNPEVMICSGFSNLENHEQSEFWRQVNFRILLTFSSYVFYRIVYLLVLYRNCEV
jgi:hypothetical protein